MSRAEGAAPRCNRTERPPPGSSAAGRSVGRARAHTRRGPRLLGLARRTLGLHPLGEASRSNEGAAPRRSRMGRRACRIPTGEQLPLTWGRSDGEGAEQNWAPLPLLDPEMAISPTGPLGEAGARGEIVVTWGGVVEASNIRPSRDAGGLIRTVILCYPPIFSWGAISLIH